MSKKLNEITYRKRVQILEEVKQLLNETEDVNDAMNYVDELADDFDLEPQDAKRLVEEYSTTGQWPQD